MQKYQIHRKYCIPIDILLYTKLLKVYKSFLDDTKQKLEYTKLIKQIQNYLGTYICELNPNFFIFVFE